MPISKVIQPNILFIDKHLRLRKYDGFFTFALPWYQDEETVKLVDGKNDLYDIERLKKMYNYLDNQGELYFIEAADRNNKFFPIGDVTFCKDDLPIVIGNKLYRKKGIGKKVIAKLIERAKQLGYDSLYVKEIYNYNIGSQKLFESMGFYKIAKTAEGNSYYLKIESE